MSALNGLDVDGLETASSINKSLAASGGGAQVEIREVAFVILRFDI
jgi:hypothetical protein